MIVGMLRVVIAIPEARSLKDKRSVVRRVLDWSRAKFNVAAAEVGMMDVHRQAELGFSLVSNDHRHMQSMLDHLTSFVANASDALVQERSFVIEHRTDLAERGRALELGSMDAMNGGDDPYGDEP